MKPTPPPAPIEPPPSRWALPPAATLPADVEDLVITGGDLEPGTLLAAYRVGLFPMHVRDGRRRVLGWWSPNPRAVLPLDQLRVSRSLRKSCRRFEIRVDTAFADVIAACGDPRRDGAWIHDDIRAAYTELHRLGWAHSVEAWLVEGDREELAGGLYGVAVGGLFAGESMFHRHTDASKVALVGLVERLNAGGGLLLDVQWRTDHLGSLGAVEIPRPVYAELIADIVTDRQLTLTS